MRVEVIVTNLHSGMKQTGKVTEVSWNAWNGKARQQNSALLL